MEKTAGPPFELFASTALGLESIAAGEMKLLGGGMRAAGGGSGRAKQEVGGVSFRGDLEVLYRANLWLRTASRVLVRLGRFHASTFYELERRAKKVEWSGFLPSEGAVTVRATCRKSRLYHSDAVAERVLAAIARVAPAGVSVEHRSHNVDREMEEESSDQPTSSQLFVVRIVNDEVEISADSSGELLHRRGYRSEVAKAPLRETLAAAMVLASGWRKNEPLLDPLCGSGTIPIEASLIARNIAPGVARDFQFMLWPTFDARRWNDIVGEARAAVTSASVDVRGADRDAGAIDAAKRNAERAGVVDAIDLSVASLSESLAGLGDADRGPGWILTNPPYGVRVGEDRDLRNLYAVLGTAVQRHAAWRAGLLTADQQLAGQLGLHLRSRFDSRNGGIPVSFLVSEKPTSR
jgi:putative N6-adenine-specific DNA methylase